MRGRGLPQGWDQASGRASASPPGAPPAPRCLIRALAGVSLEPQDFLSCGGKVREVRGGSWGSQSLGRKRAGRGGVWGRMERVLREEGGEERGGGLQGDECGGVGGGEKAFMSPEPGRK